MDEWIHAYMMECHKRGYGGSEKRKITSNFGEMRSGKRIQEIKIKYKVELVFVQHWMIVNTSSGEDESKEGQCRQKK